MHLPDLFPIFLPRTRKLTEERRQLAEENGEDQNAEDDNDKDVSELKRCSLRYITVSDSSNGHNGPINRTNKLRENRLIVKAVANDPVLGAAKRKVSGTSKQATAEDHDE